MTKKNQIATSFDSIAQAVGIRVAFLREEREISSADLAQTMAMDVNYLWRIEAGRQNLSLRNVARLAQALNVTLSEFFQDIDISMLEIGPRPYKKRPSSGSLKSLKS